MPSTDREMLKKKCGCDKGEGSRKGNRDGDIGDGNREGNRKGNRDGSIGVSEIGWGYTTLTGEMLEVKLSVEFRGKRAVCGMRFVEELDYPLMYVEKVEDVLPGCQGMMEKR